MKTLIKHKKIHHITESELLAESETLEALLQQGKLSSKEARHLMKIRAALEQFENFKDGPVI